MVDIIFFIRIDDKRVCFHSLFILPVIFLNFCINKINTNKIYVLVRVGIGKLFDWYALIIFSLRLTNKLYVWETHYNKNKIKFDFRRFGTNYRRQRGERPKNIRIFLTAVAVYGYFRKTISGCFVISVTLLVLYIFLTFLLFGSCDEFSEACGRYCHLYVNVCTSRRLVPIRNQTDRQSFVFFLNVIKWRRTRIPLISMIMRIA